MREMVWKELEFCASELRAAATVATHVLAHSLTREPLSLELAGKISNNLGNVGERAQPMILAYPRDQVARHVVQAVRRMKSNEATHRAHRSQLDNLLREAAPINVSRRASRRGRGARALPALASTLQETEREGTHVVVHVEQARGVGSVYSCSSFAVVICDEVALAIRQKAQTATTARTTSSRVLNRRRSAKHD